MLCKILYIYFVYDMIQKNAWGNLDQIVLKYITYKTQMYNIA